MKRKRQKFTLIVDAPIKTDLTKRTTVRKIEKQLPKGSKILTFKKEHGILYSIGEKLYGEKEGAKTKRKKGVKKKGKGFFDTFEDLLNADIGL